MANDLLSGLQPAGGEGPRKPGRPKGSKGKRSIDLARYIEAHYGGMTPGQQAAAVGMVTAKEVRDAKGNVLLALAAKAAQLAAMLKIDRGEAWDLMRKERAELLPYVHQKRPQAVDLTSGGEAIQPVIMGLPMAPPNLPALEGEYEVIQQLRPLSVEEVARSKSHDDDQGQAGQEVEGG